ncbi:hypothetical protein V9T40_014070 [Parthenolecanium corni]|uniref:DUF3752 domain-containing protein n=1 Tax=Parthenolecanium corni TaxID=536013 RepID=A0AAN9Y202_9HEMI
MERGIIGPVLPDDFPVGTSDDKNEETSKSDLYGPQLPQHLLNSQRVNEEEEEDDDEDSKNIIGPLPAHLASSSSSFQALNERAELLRFKNSMREIDADQPTKREEWMTELPPENTQIFGFGSRKFRMNSNEQKPGRSLWTDTPNSKPKEKTTSESTFFEKSVIDKRNQVMDEIVKRSKKHKKEKKPLLELHQEKMKKKKKKDKREGHVERRPFDRDVDLQTNRFDEAQKRSIISKAKLLDSRFKAGHSKYL